MTPQESAPHITVEPFHDAEAFLDALAPRDSRWSDYPWVFRGHSDARWPLLPNALRSNVQLGFYAKAPVGPRPTYVKQIRKEIDLLFSFLRAANQQGMTLPPIAEEVWSASNEEIDHLITSIWESGIGWPLRRWMPLLALAQHYAIPTRLLDWTSQGRVAAYFAAERAARWVRDPKSAPEGARHLEVWAASYVLVEHLTSDSLHGPRIEFREVLRSWNPNLHAQHGLFSVVLDVDPRLELPPNTTPLDEIVAASYDPANREDGLPGKSSHKPLHRLSLPLHQAPHLLRLLSREGVTAATVYPGYAAAARTLDDQRYFDA